MSDPDLNWIEDCLIRAAAEQAEFAKAVRGVLGAEGGLLTDNNLSLPGRDRRILYHRLRQVLNTALASIPDRVEYPIRQPGTRDEWLVAADRRHGAGAGR